MADPDLIHCPACSSWNRVPRDRVTAGQRPVCGKCKAPLEAAHGALVVTDSNFEAEVTASPLPVLLDMWAPWCGPCRMVTPIVEELAAELRGRVLVGKLNVDESPVSAGRFNVRSIPTLLVLKNGREVDRMVGAQPKGEIVRRLQAHLS